MGFFDWLFGTSPPPSSESPDTVADRIDRYADRCASANDTIGEEEARIAAGDARRAPAVGRALQLERDLYRQHGLRDDGRPARPTVGESAGTGYVRLGRQVRAGGSKPWRYNNPGYVRCSDRSTSYGAVGCDGEWAIFESEHAGVLGFHRALQAEHPSRPIGEAVREMLPAEQAGDVLQRLQEQGVDLAASVLSLGEGAVNTLGSALTAGADWAAGAVYDRGGESPVPDWVTDVYDAPTGGGTDDPPAVTDNS